MSFVKHINVNDGSQRKYEDQTVAELQLDTKPELGSFNGVTSDAVARAVAGASGEVPQVTEDDNGKVLKAVYDEGGPGVEWSEAVTVDQSYDAASTNAQSGTAVSEAVSGVNAPPVPSVSDEGKVLSVAVSRETASMEWTEPGSDVVWVEIGSATFQEVWDAAQAGKAVYACAAGERPPTEDTTTFNYFKLSYIEKSSWGGSMSRAVFERVTGSRSDVEVSVQIVDGSDQWSNESFSGTLVPSYSTGDDGKVLGVVDNSGTAELQWVSAGGSSDQPLPAVGTNVLRFEFENMSFDPTNDAGCNFTGTSWAKVTEATTRNIWDCTLASAPSSSAHFEITAWCHVIDGRYGFALSHLFCGASLPYSPFDASLGLRSVNLMLTGNAVHHASADWAFAGCTSLEKVRLTSNEGAKFTSAVGMFTQCTKLEEVRYISPTRANASWNYAHLGIEGTSAKWMFQYCTRLKTVQGLAFDSTGGLDAKDMFSGCNSLESIGLMFAGVGTSFHITSANNMFSNCYCLKEIGSLKFSATSLASVFQNCRSLERIALLDLNNSVTSMSGAFQNCYSLAEVNIVNSSSVIDWSSTFALDDQSSGVPARLKLPELDTSGATDVAGMFENNIYADGALAMYQQLSQQANPPTTTTGCFTNCGSITHASDLAQIPSSWGGTGA